MAPPERAVPFPPPPTARSRSATATSRASPSARPARAAPRPRPPAGSACGRIPGPIDAPLLAAYTDAWPPALFTQLDRAEIRAGVPTLDLTVHFRAPWPAHLDPADFVLVAFRSRMAHEGFVEEDGEIWTRDGLLLAQSRQLAVIG